MDFESIILFFWSRGSSVTISERSLLFCTHSVLKNGKTKLLNLVSVVQSFPTSCPPPHVFFLSLLASFSSFLLSLEHCQAKTVAQPRMCIYNTAVTCFPDNAERTGFFFFNVIFLPSKAVLKCSLC